MNNHLKELQKEVDKIKIKNDLEEVIIITKYIMELEEEIARLNKIIDELEKWNNEKSKGRLERTPYDEVNIKLQELKEEGRSQEIPLFEGTMDQLDNLTILKEEGNKDE